MRPLECTLSSQHFSATHLSQAAPAGMKLWQQAVHVLHAGLDPGSAHTRWACNNGDGRPQTKY